MATVKINGLEGLQQKMSNLSSELSREIKLLVLDSATQIELDAVGAAPIGIKQLIDKQAVNNGLGAEVGVTGSNLIPIYVEFGTGTDAASYVPTLPKDVQAVARSYYINGKGTIKKQPYLFPAFFRESPKFIEELKKLLNAKI
jgi:hypothetical protein